MEQEISYEKTEEGVVEKIVASVVRIPMNADQLNSRRTELVNSNASYSSFIENNNAEIALIDVDLAKIAELQEEAPE